jgi:hypothetical protein
MAMLIFVAMRCLLPKRQNIKMWQASHDSPKTKQALHLVTHQRPSQRQLLLPLLSRLMLLLQLPVAPCAAAA